MPVSRLGRGVITFIAVLGVIGLLSVLLFLSSRPAGQASTATVQNIPYEVRIETKPDNLQVDTPATVRLHVLQSGQPIDLNENGRLFHVVIASADLGDIYHTLSPTREAVGIYTVDHVFTRPGRYRIWTEVDNTTASVRHDQHAEQIAYTEVSVDGGTASPIPETVTEAVVDSYRVQLATPALKAGTKATLKVSVFNEAGKLMQLEHHEPFLYAISGESFSFFRHGHGVTLPDGAVALENTFPAAGRYVWWMQLFVQEGEEYRAIEVPFILKVS